MEKNPIRIDASDKVTGKAQYTADLYDSKMLVGAVLGSQYAHARILNIDDSEAKKLPGVLAVLTAKDAPENYYTPCGHPFSFTPSEVKNMRILTDKARYVGDPIAAVVARSEEIARKAISLLNVEYEVLDSVFTTEDAMKEGAPQIHDMIPGNILSDAGECFVGIPIEEAKKEAVYEIQGRYSTSAVCHSHLELCCSYAYLDSKKRITVVTATQIPVLVRYRLAEAFNVKTSDIRIIKPYVGGGFGNKQDAQQEPLNVLMSMAVGGRPVRFCMSREECMVMTRFRYAFDMDFKLGADRDGNLLYVDMLSIGNGGAYATHNHSIALTTTGSPRKHYAMKAGHFKPITVYTNLPSGGAMRGYGTPQASFAYESAIEDLIYKIGMDPVEFRLKNFISEGWSEPDGSDRVRHIAHADLIRKGAEIIGWKEKRERYSRENTGNIRHGVGCAMFAFTSGTFPVNVEPGSARISLQDDGTFILQVGATEIGQGSDTVFCQMAAEILDVSMSSIRIVTMQDTDISPYDTGAFATRQTYVTGTAVVKAANEIKRKILAYAAKLKTLPEEALDLKGGNVIAHGSGAQIMTLNEVGMHSYYNKIEGAAITADVSIKQHDDAPVFGCTFAEVAVDIEACQVKLLHMVNVHDSGRIINMRLAEGQVHGGMSMGMGYGLMEQMQYGPDGRTLNNNLLDYKLPTMLDTPKLDAVFIENYEESGPLGAKGLGEPPACSPAGAIRNAILHATGVGFNSLPITPHKMFLAFREHGLL